MASDCAQQFTPRAGSDVISTEAVNAMELVGRQGAWRYFVVFRVSTSTRGDGERRKEGESSSRG